jgi:hypothetical protein
MPLERVFSELPGPGGYQGRVVIAGRSFPITAIGLVNGSMTVEFVIPGGTPAMRGRITVFGRDDQGCWQGREYITPPIPDTDCWVFHYQLFITQVVSADETTDFSTLT